MTVLAHNDSVGSQRPTAIPQETQSSDVQLSFEPGEKDKHPAIWHLGPWKS